MAAPSYYVLVYCWNILPLFIFYTCINNLQIVTTLTASIVHRSSWFNTSDSFGADVSHPFDKHGW